jgi:hypothetical protein
MGIASLLLGIIQKSRGVTSGKTGKPAGSAEMAENMRKLASFHAGRAN